VIGGAGQPATIGKVNGHHIGGCVRATGGDDATIAAARAYQVAGPDRLNGPRAGCGGNEGAGNKTGVVVALHR